MSNQKERLANATISYLHQAGLEGFTMDKMAVLTCMSKKTIYKLFQSKEELLIYSIDCFFQNMKQKNGSDYKRVITSLV